jgi:putative iron-dependent peroxidase
MSQPQPALLPEPSSSALFAILRIDPAAARERIGRAIAELPKQSAKVAALDPRAKLVSAVSIGSELWDRLSPAARPKGLHAFRAVAGPRFSAPSTGGDLLLHLISKREDLNVELALRVRAALGETASVVEEVQGFRYLDSRDLTGFIDGTENPKGRERTDAALIGVEDKAFAGGSYAFTQRYVHDLSRWAGVPVADQEKIIGRKKRDSKELANKPETAHIARTVIEENGEELEILRHSFLTRAAASRGSSSSPTRAISRFPRRCSRACSAQRATATTTGSWSTAAPSRGRISSRPRSRR